MNGDQLNVEKKKKKKKKKITQIFIFLLHGKNNSIEHTSKRLNNIISHQLLNVGAYFLFRISLADMGNFLLFLGLLLLFSDGLVVQNRSLKNKKEESRKKKKKKSNHKFAISKQKRKP